MSEQPWEGTGISVALLDSDEQPGVTPLTVRISVPLVRTDRSPEWMPAALTLTTDWPTVAELKGQIAAIEMRRLQAATAAGRAAVEEQREKERATVVLRSPAPVSVDLLQRLHQGLTQMRSPDSTW